MKLDRRAFLRAAGVALALPRLDAFARACGPERAVPRRMVSHASPIAFPPVAQAETAAHTGPCAPVSCAVRDGDTSRSARAMAASVRVLARSSALHGNVMIQWPGSDERWTASPPRPSPWSARVPQLQPVAQFQPWLTSLLIGLEVAAIARPCFLLDQ